MGTYDGRCSECGQRKNDMCNPCFCPGGPIPPKVESREPATVSSLAVARFDKIPEASSHEPAAALEKALAYLRDPDEPDYDHAIVILGRTPEGGGSAAIWFQAGKYEYHAQMGLLFEGGQMIRENG